MKIKTPFREEKTKAKKMQNRRTPAELRLPDGPGIADYVTENMGLVGRVIRSMPWLMAQFASLREDIEQVGRLALAKSYRDFDESKGFKRSTHATTIIVNDLRKWAKRQRRPCGRLNAGMRVQCFRPDEEADYAEQIAPYLARMEWANEKHQGELFDAT